MFLFIVEEEDEEEYSDELEDEPEGIIY